MKSVVVLGYFGYLTNQIDGQTIKTREIYGLLNKFKASNFTLSFFDTENFKLNKMYFFKLIKQLKRSDIVYYLPGKKNLTYIFPIIFLLSKIFKFEIIYPVVGGWLPNFLKKRSLHVFLLKKIKAVLVESELMVNELKNKFDFEKVEVLYNFRDHNFTPNFHTEVKEFRLVFMARVMREKGIFRVLEFIEYMQTVNVEFTFTMDFFGPIQERDKYEFLNAIAKFSNVNYKGVVEPSKVFETLNKYDLLLLPTFYEGEGFPGTIVDAYISGLPVIVSKWKLLPSFVINGCTGFVYSNDIENDFNTKIVNLLKNPLLLKQMKLNSYNYSKQFSAENSKTILLKYI